MQQLGTLLVHAKDASRKSAFPVVRSPVFVGRGADCDIRLTNFAVDVRHVAVEIAPASNGGLHATLRNISASCEVSVRVDAHVTESRVLPPLGSCQLHDGACFEVGGRLFELRLCVDSSLAMIDANSRSAPSTPDKRRTLAAAEAWKIAAAVRERTPIAASKAVAAAVKGQSNHVTHPVCTQKESPKKESDTEKCSFSTSAQTNCPLNAHLDLNQEASVDALLHKQPIAVSENDQILPSTKEALDINTSSKHLPVETGAVVDYSFKRENTEEMSSCEGYDDDFTSIVASAQLKNTCVDHNSAVLPLSSASFDDSLVAGSSDMRSHDAAASSSRDAQCTTQQVACVALVANASNGSSSTKKEISCVEDAVKFSPKSDKSTSECIIPKKEARKSLTQASASQDSQPDDVQQTCKEKSDIVPSTPVKRMTRSVAKRSSVDDEATASTTKRRTSPKNKKAANPAFKQTADDHVPQTPGTPSTRSLRSRK